MKASRAWTAAVVLPFVTAVAVVVLVPRSGAAARPSAAPVTPVASIYLRDCAVCHGGDGHGSERGPSLVAVGRAALQYYLTTGRMPLGRPDEIPSRHAPRYDPATTNALIDYVSNLTGGGGVDIPRIDLARADVPAGGELYRLNCAACHSWAGTGGALSTRIAPSLRHSTPQQIADAVRVGPGFMPAFGTAAISDQQLSDLVAATHQAAHPRDRGGYSLAHIGPLAEGAVAIVVGVGLLLFFTLWIGTRKT